jgi:ElaB/YqjD/DUF883 family membrane-anchored ribosome-binding protein
MFQYRSSAFGPSVNAIQKHLGAVEKELETIGRLAGRRGSAAASQAGEQIGDAVSSLVNDMIERFTARGRAASDQAAVYGTQALKLGRSYGNDALQRVGAQVSTQVEQRPLITLGVALGLGVLIGAAVLSNMASAKPISAKPRKR